ncbi:hypothetical protein SRRS_46790 [Sporomusa rhizae]|uniref:hypothetical protein n=1 Tax=Sporomusa rhizae TaxID=357999 RepID=UPI003529E8D4
MNMAEAFSKINEQRQKNGFFSIPELLELEAKGNLILDPFSTLISSSVEIGTDNKFYSGVIIETKNNGTIYIGNGNTFWPNSLIRAEYGKVQIGDSNQFGDGGVSIKANTKQSNIHIGDHGRYINGVQILGCSYLGSCSQVIGNITVQDCHLDEGESFMNSDPDVRGGVLKGYGLARNIRVKTGMVINGQGVFTQENMIKQSFFHPIK